MPRNVIIVGMARSGTSLTAGVFARKGYAVGAIANPRMRDGDDSNPFGYFEADDVIEANVGILGRAGFPHHNTWRYAPITPEQARRIGELSPSAQDRRLIESYAERSPWLWKDPRLCFTLRYWWPLLESAAAGVVLVRRDPEKVWNSFRRRGWCGGTSSERRRVTDLAEAHHAAARRAVRDLAIPHVEVDFAEYLECPTEVARRLSEHLELCLTPADLNVRRELDHSTGRGRRTIPLRLLARKIPKPVRPVLRRFLPGRLIATVLPEWKYVRRGVRSHVSTSVRSQGHDET